MLLEHAHHIRRCVVRAFCVAFVILASVLSAWAQEPPITVPLAGALPGGLDCGSLGASNLGAGGRISNAKVGSAGDNGVGTNVPLYGNELNGNYPLYSTPGLGGNYPLDSEPTP